MAGDVALAGRLGGSATAGTGPVVRANGRAHAVVPRAADLGVGRQVRSCCGRDELRRDAALLAVGHFLFGSPACAGVPEGEPRQPILLCHLRFSHRLPWRQRFPIVDWRYRTAGPERGPLGGMLHAPEERMEDKELNTQLVLQALMILNGS